MAGAFEEERKDDVVEALIDVDGLVVDVILHGVTFEFGGRELHQLTIVVGHLGRINLETLAAFEVDEKGGTVGVVEEEFVRTVEGVEEEHLMFAMTEMAKGIEEGLAFGIGDDGVGEDDDDRTSMELLGKEVQIGGKEGGAGRDIGGRRRGTLQFVGEEM